MPVRNDEMPSKKSLKHPCLKPPSSLAQRDLNRMIALELANDYGFGNKTLLAKHCFGKSADPNHQAARFQKKLEKNGFIKVIDLDGNGSVYTLTRMGINMLEVNDVKVIGKGKELGRMELCPDGTKRFVPPLNFYHTLLSATGLACLAEKGWIVFTERQIRQTLAVGDNIDRYDPKLKIPDGIAISPTGQVYLVEVENARKTSHDLERLIKAIVSPNKCFNAYFHLGQLLDRDPSPDKQDEIAGTIVVYDPKSVSSDLRKLDHRKLIFEKVEEALCSSHSTSKLIFCECDVRARNVVDIQLHQELLLIGELIQIDHYHDEPEVETPELAVTNHSVQLLPNLKPTVTIEGYCDLSGETVYEYSIDGMTVCEYDRDFPDAPRGHYASRKEAYWFAIHAMHHGLNYDLKNRPDAIDDHLN